MTQLQCRFFHSRTAYDAEMRHYNTPAIAAILPPRLAHQANVECALTHPRPPSSATDIASSSTSASQRPPSATCNLPPFIATRRGISARDWWSAVRPPPGEALRALAAIASQLASLHGAGLVHRRIASAALLRMPDGRWCIAGGSAICAVGMSLLLVARLPHASLVVLDPHWHVVTQDGLRLWLCIAGCIALDRSHCITNAECTNVNPCAEMPLG